MLLARDKYALLSYAVIAAIMLVPLLSVAIPPLVDLPNHISRLHILATLGDDLDLQKNYVTSWGPIPNLAIDALGLPLTRMTSPYVAGKVFAVLTFVMALLGMYALHYAAHRSVNVWSGVIFFLAYNQTFMIGLLNFYFGVGLAFLLLAAWIMYEGERRALKLWLFPAGALALYFCHLLAFGVYGLLIAGYELSVLFQCGERRVTVLMRRAAGTGLQFLLPLALLIFTLEFGTQLDGRTVYGSLLHKLLSLLAPIRFYADVLDLAAILFLILLLSFAWWKEQLRIAPGLGVPLLVFAILAVAAPSILLNVFGGDLRFAVVAGMLFFAAIRIELSARGPAALLLVTGLTLMAWRAADLTIHWRAFNAQFAELRHAAKVMDRGASVLPVQGRDGEQHHSKPSGSILTYWHIASLAVMERSLFNPLTFTTHYQPIKAHPDRKRIDCGGCTPLSIVALRVLANPEISWETLELPYEGRIPYRHAAHWPERFDYVLVVDFGDHRNPVPEFLKSVHTGSFFVIYKVQGPSPG